MILDEKGVTLKITPKWWAQQNMEWVGRAITVLTKKHGIQEVRAFRDDLYVVLHEAPDNWTMASLRGLSKQLQKDIENIEPDDRLREALADYAHAAWSGWMQYMFDKSQCLGGEVIIPESLVKRWKRQMTTTYADLSEDEKTSDRKEADKILKLYSASLRE